MQFTIEQAMQIGIQHHQAGRLAEAEGIYRQVLAHHPNHPDALNLLGVLAAQSGQPGTAVDLIRHAVELNPGHAEAHSNLGHVLLEVGRADEAVVACRRALQLAPGYAAAYNNLGNALGALGQTEEALAASRQAIQLQPRFAEAYHNVGNHLKSQGKLTEAADAYREAVRLKPEYAEAHNNLGIVLLEQDKVEESVAVYHQLTRLKPSYAEAHTNLGNALRRAGRPAEAIAAHRRAIELTPDIAEAHWNLGLVLLATGDLISGWQEYEWRWKAKGFPYRMRDFAQSQWRGEKLNGRTILLHAEQGLGDTIQFVRYATEVAAAGGKVILECQAELCRLLNDFPGVSQIVAAGQPLPAFDLHCPLMSLPFAFATRLESIPRSAPYLMADSKLQSDRARLLEDDSRRIKVGLAWAGRPTHQNDRIRSIELNTLAPLAGAKGVRFYSLQKGPAARQAGAPDAAIEVVDFSDQLVDFVDTAALIANLDLVITVDTAVAHLAGAMGKPVWVLLAHLPDWRWMLDREDSPWYPTMRLFRQNAPGQWNDVIARVAECLENFVARASSL
jgi:tetratricopeptide (TPR) repeat protein